MTTLSSPSQFTLPTEILLLESTHSIVHPIHVKIVLSTYKIFPLQSQLDITYK